MGNFRKFFVEDILFTVAILEFLHCIQYNTILLPKGKLISALRKNYERKLRETFCLQNLFPAKLRLNSFKNSTQSLESLLAYIPSVIKEADSNEILYGRAGKSSS